MIAHWVATLRGVFLLVADELGWRPEYDFIPTHITVVVPPIVTEQWRKRRAECRGWAESDLEHLNHGH